MEHIVIELERIGDALEELVALIKSRESGKKEDSQNGTSQASDSDGI